MGFIDEKVDLCELFRRLMCYPFREMVKIFHYFIILVFSSFEVAREDVLTQAMEEHLLLQSKSSKVPRNFPAMILLLSPIRSKPPSIPTRSNWGI